MQKYRLLSGMHTEKGVVYIGGEEGRDVIETDRDLTKVTNGAQPRFQVISNLEGVPQQDSAAVFRAKMQAKNASELRKWAAEEEFNLGDATTKKEMFNTIVGEFELA